VSSKIGKLGPVRSPAPFRGSQTFYVALVGFIYLLLIGSKGTQNTFYFEDWIEGFVKGDFFSLYHVVPHQGILEADNLTVPYPPFSLYVLGLVAKILILAGGEFPSVFLVASNLTSVIFTFLTALLLGFWGKDKALSKPIIYLLTPAVFLTSPILGYQDTIMSFFILAALLLAEKEKYLLAGIAASLAVFSKQLAVMPMFGLSLLIIFSTNWRTVMRALVGFLSASAAILLPFLMTGTLIAYFQAQALASVHTMMSAKNPNFPWLISMISRINSQGFFNVKSYSSLPYHIDDQIWRQRIYLLFAILTIQIIILYLIYWSRRIGRKNVGALYVSAVSISAYNLFSFGVHENHVFMLIPVLFSITWTQMSKKIYLVVSTAFGLNLLATGGFGLSVPNFPLLAALNGPAYSALGLACLTAYLWAFVEILRINPRRIEKMGTGSRLDW
jgi:Gpi18-like mannosyltransferase